jgi:hypothetical protein
MRDGSTRRQRTRPQETVCTSERVQVDDWRRHGRLDDLRALAEGAGSLVLSRGLLQALLEELHISDDFDALVGRVARWPASQYPRLLAIALLLRHSWCPLDLARTATRLGLPRPHVPSASHPHAPRWRTPPLRNDPYAAQGGPYPLKGDRMSTPTPLPPASARGHRVRELVCAYRPLRNGDGRVVDVPTVVLKDPRTAASVLAPLIADQSVEVFAVACLSTTCRLLAWHVVSRGTRTRAPVSMPDVFVPACLTPGTTGLMVVHNHPSGDPTPSPDDARLTLRLCAAADVLDLPLLDHLIVGDAHRYYSFREAGLMEASSSRQ